jgi:hypothetical protein
MRKRAIIAFETSPHLVLVNAWRVETDDLRWVAFVSSWDIVQEWAQLSLSAALLQRKECAIIRTLSHLDVCRPFLELAVDSDRILRQIRTA